MYRQRKHQQLHRDQQHQYQQKFNIRLIPFNIGGVIIVQSYLSIRDWNHQGLFH